MIDTRRVARGAVAAGDAVALWGFRPYPATLLPHLAAPHAWLADVGADRAALELAGVAAWLVAGWFGLALLTMVAATLPGTAGRLAAACSYRLVPATVHRVLAGALGLGVILAPIAASAATTGAALTSAGQPAAAVAVAAGSLPAPVWPTDPVHSTHPPHRPPALRPGVRSGSTTGSSPDHYIVQPGDSLWLIAARRDPQASAAQIATAWPRWYAANRSRIGTDPDRLRPGQVLQAPSSAHASESS